MLTPLLIATTAGYFLGALPFGYLVARAHGVDIFTAGSGNPGATNVKRTVGSKAGNLVFALDFLKGLAAAGWPWLSDAMRHSPFARAHGIEVLQIAGLVGAVTGHSFSIFTRFRGGKGVATTGGGLFVLLSLPCLIGGATWVVVFYAWRYVSLASICAAAAVPAAAWALGFSPALKTVSTLLGVLVIARHCANIRRLLDGTEHRWARHKKEPAP